MAHPNTPAPPPSSPSARVRLTRMAQCLLGAGSLLMAACGGAGNGGGGGTCTAACPVLTYVLTVDSTNPASGTPIAVSPADETGSGNGVTGFTRIYAAGATVTLTAPATSGTGTFASWTGCTSASATNCTVSMTASTTVTANYTAAPATYTVTVASTNPASGTPISVTPSDATGAGSGVTGFTRTYAAGSAVTLTAPATSGTGVFANWTGCTSTAGNACTLNVTANTTVTANYTPAPVTYTLTVASTNPAGGTPISVTPSDATGAGNGVTGFTRTYTAGSAVTLTAPAKAGANTFANWTGCSTASTTTCNVTLNADTAVTANYTPAVTYTLTVNSTNPASGTSISVAPADVNGLAAGTTVFTRTYVAGTGVVLTAPAAAGANPFANWNGCTTIATVTCNVSMTANTTVTANYTLPPGATSVTVTPATAAVTIGTTQQFTASVQGNGAFSQAVTWKLTGPTGYTGGLGTISSTGLYTSPYPAPATVTVAG